MIEDDDRTGAQLLAVGRAEEPSRSRQHPEHREVVSRDHAAEDGLGTGCVRVRAVARRHSRGPQAHRPELEAVRIHAIQRRGALPDVEIVGIGDQVDAEVAFRAADVDEALRLGHAGRRAEQKAVGHRENRRRGGDANGQRQGRGEREEPVASQ